MFRFNKDMEYALISLLEMSRNSDDQLITARALSDRYAIPFKLLARILSQLSASGMIEAIQGPRGGYRLSEKPEEIQLGRVIRVVRGNEVIADCLSSEKICAQESRGCTIKSTVEMFRDKWIEFVEKTTLDIIMRSATDEVVVAWEGE